ncbi:phosphatidic acid phosphatase type 2/haloperoxidase [Xylariaceae sp. FL0594]|nr:phosphatidic acid phosphatase type 2/haloperoxidase [Xylariaceae sp. FL0594]
MGLFNRQPAGAQNGGHVKEHGGHRDVGSTYTMSRRPTFGQWLKATWLDILTFIIMGALGLGIYMAPPAPSRSFAVTFADGEIVYPQFAYPLRKEIIPIWLAAFLAAIVPILAILIMQIRVRSFWDVNNGIIGLLYALIGAAVFQVFVKFLIGGLRPHFLDVCKPDISLARNGAGIEGSPYNGAGFQQLYFTPEICTGDRKEINDSLESMPSGHTTAAFAGFVYLYLYLNAKLKVFSNYHPSMWKLIVIYIPILGAVLIGGALTIDEYHNWYDVFAGAAIGTVFAFSAYRMCYAAIWDWRWNHIPLHRNQPCLYTNDVELVDAMWTRKAGWDAGPASGRHGTHRNGVVGPSRSPNHHTAGGDMV